MAQLPSANGSRHQGPQRTFYLQVTFRFAFACRFKAPVKALRAMPGAHKKGRRQKTVDLDFTITALA